MLSRVAYLSKVKFQTSLKRREKRERERCARGRKESE